MSAGSLLPPVLALLASPLLLGVVTRTRAVFAGRRGAPLLQPYHDLFRLLRKGAVYSRRTTLVFRIAPVVVLASTAAAVCTLPFGPWDPPLVFPFDLVLFAYLLALSRFAIVLGALDTGSSFEGMGASRELLFGALAEPALFLALLVLVANTGELSLSGLLGASAPAGAGMRNPAATALVLVTLFVVALAEGSRIPFDDPATHLELTMVHEVMILDHSGPDLAILQYASALKLWALGLLVVGVALPRALPPLAGALAWGAGLLAFAVGVGVVESTTARVRMSRVPQVLVGSALLAALALLLLSGMRP